MGMGRNIDVIGRVTYNNTKKVKKGPLKVPRFCGRRKYSHALARGPDMTMIVKQLTQTKYIDLGYAFDFWLWTLNLCLCTFGFAFDFAVAFDFWPWTLNLGLWTFGFGLWTLPFA